MSQRVKTSARGLVLPYCTGIECCVEIPQIDTTFHVYLLLDSCLHKLKIGIENLGMEKTYFDFKFGMYPNILHEI
jgi:hypothetical protein